MKRNAYTAGLILWLLAALFVLAPRAMAAQPAAEPAAQPAAQPAPDTIMAEAPALDAAAQEDEPAEEDTSVLPPEFNQIIASLGIYILTMFTMAIGTEIAVDVFKQLFGLKSKPTARKALEEFEDLLPGNVESLGADVEAHRRLQKQIGALRNVLQPFMTAQDILDQLQDGELKTAVETVLRQVDVLPPDKTLRDVVKPKLKETVYRLSRDLGLEKLLTDYVWEQISRTIGGIDPDNLQSTLQLAINQIRSELITAWIRMQLNNLTESSRNSIEQQFELVLKPQLTNFGLTDDQIAIVSEWFNDLLDSAENYSGRQLDIYLESLNELLLGVERQRYLLQSPARRSWRRMWGLDNWLGGIFRRIEGFWNGIMGRTKMDMEAFTQTELIRDVSSAARIILERDQQHESESANRVRLIRTLSVLVAIFLAYMLQIDSADLLSGLLPADPTANFLTTILIAENQTVMGITFARELTAGILLTGLAASAGSSFWHDRLSQLQSAKQTADAAASVLREISSGSEKK